MEAPRFVDTIKERCRMCYTCVRECPAKAIRIVEGQAEVIGRRCIACGNCVRICSQKAKQVVRSVDIVERLLAQPDRVAAIVAPSFPKEFDACDYTQVVGMLRALGFDLVNEVAFGADLVAEWYRRMLNDGDHWQRISTACPAVVAFVEKYHPELVESLAPVVSPMVACARALKRTYGDSTRIVFIGPCVAKKAEAASESLRGEVDAVLTFIELGEMLSAHGVTPETVTPAEFDPPHGGLGALFPISRGMLQAAHIDEDLVDGEVVATEGRTNFVDAVEEFAQGGLRAKLLEVLACQGCIMGPGMTRKAALFSSRAPVARYVARRLATLDEAAWRRSLEEFGDLDLSRSYTVSDQRIAVPEEDLLQRILRNMGKLTPEDELNCGACGYDTCREHAAAICKGLAENEMCLPYTIDQLRTTIQDLAATNDRLANTQAALIQSEKLASMGQLAAGIAHEVNNPLGVVLMYAHLLHDQQGSDPHMSEDLDMIVRQADRCRKIVSGLLHFARQNKVVLEPTDIREVVADVLRLLPGPEGVQVKTEHHTTDPVADLDRDQVTQMLTNLVTNAYAAMPDGGTLTVATADHDGQVRISVIDTGIGIKQEHLSKIFEPFFTTKQMGKGTGLGLAVTYGIVKMHRGDIQVKSNADPSAGPTGSTFTVTLPRRGQDD